MVESNLCCRNFDVDYSINQASLLCDALGHGQAPNAESAQQIDISGFIPDRSNDDVVNIALFPERISFRVPVHGTEPTSRKAVEDLYKNRVQRTLARCSGSDIVLYAICSAMQNAPVGNRVLREMYARSPRPPYMDGSCLI